MINVSTALIGLAAYFVGIFAFGLIWRKREVSQKNKKERLLQMASAVISEVSRRESSHSVERELAHLG